MRVITGKARGVQLKTPEGMLTRPTADRVKEALFSIINFDLPGAAVLEFTQEGISRVQYKDTMHYQITKRMLDHPEQMLKTLLG